MKTFIVIIVIILTFLAGIIYERSSWPDDPKVIESWRLKSYQKKLEVEDKLRRKAYETSKAERQAIIDSKKKEIDNKARAFFNRVTSEIYSVGTETCQNYEYHIYTNTDKWNRIKNLYQLNKDTLYFVETDEYRILVINKLKDCPTCPSD